jgi:hypothetical protein
VIAEAKAQLEELIANAETVGRTAAEKAAHIKGDWDSRSFAEKLGTPEALKGVRDRARAVSASIQSAMEKLATLRKAVEDLRKARA